MKIKIKNDIRFLAFIFLLFASFIFADERISALTQEEYSVLLEVQDKEGYLTVHKILSYVYEIRILENSERKDSPRTRMYLAVLYGSEKMIEDRKMENGWFIDEIIETPNVFQDVNRAKSVIADLEEEFKCSPEILYYLFNLYSKHYRFWNGTCRYYYGEIFTFIKEKADEYKELVPQNTNFDEIALSLVEDFPEDFSDLLGVSYELKREILKKRLLLRYSNPPEFPVVVDENTYLGEQYKTINKAIFYGAEKFEFQYQIARYGPVDMNVEIENPIYDIEKAKAIIDALEEKYKDDHRLNALFRGFTKKEPYHITFHTYAYGGIFDYIKERAAISRGSENAINKNKN